MPSTTATPPKGPKPEEVTRRIGDTNEQALRYVLNPDPKLARLSRKVRENLLADLPPVTAGALLGPAALARHFIASAAAGRYRDLFALWELFRQRTEECKPELAERQQALDKGREHLRTAIRLGLLGHAERVAEDVERAEGLIWTWVRDVVTADLALVGRRPAVASALLKRLPDLDIPLPERPDDQWLDEAAGARRHSPLAPSVDAVLAANADRLPATIATLAMAQEHYPERVVPLLEHVDLDSPDIGAILAWARDHGFADMLRARVRTRLGEAAAAGREQGLAEWYAWRERGVDLPLPDSLRTPSLEGLDIARPETGLLLGMLRADGVDLEPQQALNDLAARNRMLAEKAYESFVSADLPVELPAGLHDNPHVRPETRCPACKAWTWVRPGHERRCPRLAAMRAAEPEPVPAPAEHTAADDWAAAAEEVAASGAAAHSAAPVEAGTSDTLPGSREQPGDIDAPPAASQISVEGAEQQADAAGDQPPAEVASDQPPAEVAAPAAPALASVEPAASPPPADAAPAAGPAPAGAAARAETLAEEPSPTPGPVAADPAPEPVTADPAPVPDPAPAEPPEADPAPAEQQPAPAHEQPPTSQHEEPVGVEEPAGLEEPAGAEQPPRQLEQPAGHEQEQAPDRLEEPSEPQGDGFGA